MSLLYEPQALLSSISRLTVLELDERGKVHNLHCVLLLHAARFHELLRVHCRYQANHHGVSQNIYRSELSDFVASTRDGLRSPGPGTSHQSNHATSLLMMLLADAHDPPNRQTPRLPNILPIPLHHKHLVLLQLHLRLSPSISHHRRPHDRRCRRPSTQSCR